MKVFVAGASGAIGKPLVVELLRRGHEVTAMTRSAESAKKLAALGAKTAESSAFDEYAVGQALRAAEPEVVIDELTALPPDPTKMKEYAAGDRKLRLEGGGNLYRAARALGVTRYVQQASGFFLKASGDLATEADGLRTDGSWIHIEDAAWATAEALTVPPGIYNIVDDDPSPLSRWLPEFAAWVGAPIPPGVNEFVARALAGEDAVYYSTQLSGASNAKAKDVFKFKPRRLEWRGR